MLTWQQILEKRKRARLLHYTRSLAELQSEPIPPDRELPMSAGRVAENKHARPKLEALRAAREAYFQPRSITSELMGDPLPGRSALDQKRGEERTNV